MYNYNTITYLGPSFRCSVPENEERARGCGEKCRPYDLQPRARGKGANSKESERYRIGSAGSGQKKHRVKEWNTQNRLRTHFRAGRADTFPFSFMYHDNSSKYLTHEI